MGRRRISIYLPLMLVGGAERVALTLGAGFRQHGFDVDLVLGRAAGPLLAEVPEGIRVVDLHSSRMIRSVLPLARYLRRERPDAILSGLDIANLIVVWACLLAGGRLRPLLTTHTYLSRFISNPTAGMADRLYPRLLRWFFRHSAGMVAMSQAAAEDLAALVRIPQTGIRVIPNPLDADLDWKQTQPLDHPWFGKSGPPVVLSAGRLTAAKDFPTLLEAFHILHQRQPARLVILGDGELRQSLQAQAEQLGIATDLDMPGFDLNPYRYMSRCSVFVLASRFEGFGNVLVEALACGAQVVSTRCPGGPAEILGDGLYGRLVPVGDARLLAEAIEAALQDPIPAERVRAHLEAYSARTVSAAYLQALGLEPA